jgi:hypothetical protein
MEVLGVEHALTLLLDPLLLGQRLTLRTMPIATRVEDGLLIRAGRAVLMMTTEGFGAALSNVGQHPALLPVEPL